MQASIWAHEAIHVGLESKKNQCQHADVPLSLTHEIFTGLLTGLYEQKIKSHFDRGK